MRLRRLDLIRYGKFTGHSIDFGEAATPDLHIVYGPNEAGKSTTLSAFLDMLFGIETRSRYNFLHPYPAMRIGAALEMGGRVHDLVRVKKAQNDLLDAADQPVPAGLIAGQLGGIDRESYRSMFSLDDDTLEAGGESILQSKGDLGQLLFSASTGLADLSLALTNMRAEADGFYRLHSRTGGLQALKVRLGELKEARDRIDTAATAYAHLIEARDRALAAYNAAFAERAKIQSRMEDIRRQVTALPRLAALRQAREALAPLAGLPDVPAGWAEALPKLRDDDVTLATRLEEAERDVAQKAEDRAAVVVDNEALKLADRVAGWTVLQSRYVTAKDIPDRQREVRQAEDAIAAILVRIGKPDEADPQRLILDAQTVGHLRGLIETRSGIETAARLAAEELSQATAALEDAEAALRAAEPGAGGQTQALADCMAILRASDGALRRRTAERAREAAWEKLAEQLLSLRPWTGDAAELAGLAVPAPGDIATWKTALEAEHARLDKHEAEVERNETECGKLRAQLAAIGQVAGVVSDLDAAAVRSEREAAWARHRRQLDLESADAFEAAMRRDDSVMQARVRHEKERATLHQVSQRLAETAADGQRSAALRDKSADKLRRLQDQVADAVAPLLPGATLAQLAAWLDKRDRVLETLASLKQAERDLRDADADLDDNRQRLIAALTAACVPHDAAAPLDALRTIAQTALDREASLKALRETVAARKRDVTIRERKRSATHMADQAWQADWQQACAGSWLSESVPPTPVAREILAAVTDLAHLLRTRDGLLGRIDAMEQDQRAFADEVAAVADALEMPADAADQPLDRARAIRQRVQDAEAGRANLAEKTKALAAARERLRALTQARQDHDLRKAAMLTHFAVASLPEVDAAIKAAERRARLQAEAAAARADILDALRLSCLADAESGLDSADRAALEAELQGLQAQFDDQDQRTRDLYSAHGKAADKVEAVGGDDAVARIEEQRRTTLLEIEDGAMRYLKLRIGTVAAEHALRSYRQQHRSSMMEYASEAFRTISRGAYTGLASQPEKDAEILIAMAADGGSKQADDLSKGTRFQLYLALRVAGYHEFARVRPPVPFIADDIMETFDDFRSEEALRLLADMARVGQVIYLTHHRHLVEIGRRICPGVRVHELAPLAG